MKTCLCGCGVLIKEGPVCYKPGHHMRGRKRSAETKARMSEAMKGEKNPMFGRKHKEETLLKISEKGKGRIMPKGSTHSCWKADDVGYAQVHVWLRQNNIKPDNCQICKRNPVRGSS